LRTKIFVSLVLEEAEGTDKNEGLKEAGGETRCLEPEGEYKTWEERQENKRKV
jgi:hypothetical protein